MYVCMYVYFNELRSRSIRVGYFDKLAAIIYVCLYVYRRHQQCQQDLKFMYVCMYVSDSHRPDHIAQSSGSGPRGDRYATP